MDWTPVKKIPFLPCTAPAEIRQKITVREPVINGHRAVIVDFVKNPNYSGRKRNVDEGRVIIIKAKNIVRWMDIDKKVSTCKASKKLPDWWKVEEETLISEREIRMMERCFGKRHLQSFKAVYMNWTNWVMKIEQNSLREKQKEEGKLKNEDIKLCPNDIPDGLEDYIRENILPEDHVLVYEQGGRRGICSACGAEVYAPKNEKFRQGIYGTTCPSCGAEVYCVLGGGESYKAKYVENVVIAQKGKDGQTVFFRQFQIIRDCLAKWTNMKKYLKETVRYAIRGNKTAKWQLEYKENVFMRAIRFDLPDWTMWGDNKIYDNVYYFCPAGINDALQGTMMQYADIEGYLQDNPRRFKNEIYFLEYHAKYPVMEFLWKAGYKKIVREKVMGCNRSTRDAVRWSRKKLKECFKFPLRFLKFKEPEKWTLDDIVVLNAVYRYNPNAKDAEIKLAMEMGIDFDIPQIENAIKRSSIMKVLTYIRKQSEEGYTYGVTERDYCDYLQECAKLQLDLNDRMILFPRDLHEAHARTSAQVEYKTNREKTEKFMKQASMKKKYEWEWNGLFIRPAYTPEELTAEGKMLHHCVGGYADRMAAGETTIFFVRKQDEQETPYYTLELVKGKVVQCRTGHNESYEKNPQVLAFVNEWMQKVVNKKKKKEVA